MTLPFSETPTVGLGQFIREARFEVPSHQRDYSWKEEYVDQFLEDIRASMEEKDSLYFCGLMVFTKGESKAFSVLDGQQRLATTLMIFSGIRNWLNQHTSYSQIALKINERYMGDSDLGQQNVEPKIVLNSTNNATFKSLVIDQVPFEDIEKALVGTKRDDRNRTLIEAVAFANTKIREIAEEFPSKDAARDYFVALMNYMTETVQIVRLVVRGEEAAYTIFETLNDRGMELAPLDLVKNYLFSKAEKLHGKSLQDLEERWTEMMTLLSAVKADSFLRAFWASRHGLMEGRKLFSAFKRQYSEPSSAYKVSGELRSAAERYMALSDPSDPTWSAYSPSTRSSVAALAIIGATQMHPVILAALDRFDGREFERLLRLLEVIAVRYQLVERGRPGRIESLGARTAKAITEGKITTASQALVELRELYIPDEVFEASFRTKTERESKKAAYLLRGLEHQALLRVQDLHAGELAPNEVTIEHVIPKSPGKAWQTALESDPDLHTEFLTRLGNLCLLSNVNRALGNKSFAEKKAVFAKSRIRTTQFISQYSNWGRTEIKDRQVQLAKLAVAQWRFQ